MNAYRQFETSNGSLQFPELRENSANLLGKRFYENSNLDSTIDAAATADNFMAICGDIAKAFYIVDRVGSTLEIIPNLVGANQRPTGQRGALLWFRSGSEVVNAPAARLLNIPTAA
jgi:HK97 family phage major capsid protein